MPKYFLQPHIYACEIDGEIIFLDLKRRRYFGMDAAQTAALRGLLVGCGPYSDFIASDFESSQQDATALPDGLVAQGLLTRNPESGKTAASPRLPLLGAVDFEGDLGVVRFRSTLALSFLAAFARTTFKVRFWSLERIARDYGERKRSQRAAANGIRERELRELVLNCRRLRALLFTSRGACLFDSLVLLEFLARNGVFPTWVIGVTTRPFAAHSWVQHEGLVLNDTVESVEQHVPILAI